MTVRCRSCGSRLAVQPIAGEVLDVEVIHRPSCPFLAALERGRAVEWERRHGQAVVVDQGEAVRN